MLGVRLEVDAMIVTTSTTCLQNLIRCIKRAGIEIEGIVLQSFANGEITLTKDEKELGVFIIDIGGGTTEIAFFKNGILQDLSVLPIGGNHITNDLSVGLHTSYSVSYTHLDVYKRQYIYRGWGWRSMRPNVGSVSVIF